MRKHTSNISTRGKKFSSYHDALILLQEMGAADTRWKLTATVSGGGLMKQESGMAFGASNVQI